jgi:hypothetical protein
MVLFGVFAENTLRGIYMTAREGKATRLTKTGWLLFMNMTIKAGCHARLSLLAIHGARRRCAKLLRQACTLANARDQAKTECSAPKKTRGLTGCCRLPGRRKFIDRL